ncbi:MAG: hypothetical protein Q8O37_07545, partial [Sulfuricellaceae bacterium]|nr:hypothetical protein [Sulfuricellaceae bacterium]
EAKSGPGEDSFCRVCSAIAVAMGQKAGEKWTVAAALQPTSLLPPRLLGPRRYCYAEIQFPLNNQIFGKPPGDQTL